jgi:hypothetical protein
VGAAIQVVLDRDTVVTAYSITGSKRTYNRSLDYFLEVWNKKKGKK